MRVDIYVVRVQEVQNSGTRGLRDVSQPLLSSDMAPPRRLAPRESRGASKWEVEEFWARTDPGVQSVVG